ncbi:MAG: hypothetical protein L0K86_24480 [Actinomycetia bacterium]|nr:hypothetical protein [Actinomycetes bacterium]
MTASAAPMSTRVRFVDTSVLRYAVSNDPEERDKAERGGAILSARDLTLPEQVLQEFSRAGDPGRPPGRAHPRPVRAARRVVPAVPGPGDHRRCAARGDGNQAALRHLLWDAAIIEASRTLGCDVVLSEDLSDGQDYTGIRVEDPFR